MNLHPNSTSKDALRTEGLIVASTKLKSAIPQAPAILRFEICDVGDRSLPPPRGAHLVERPATPAEIAQKAYQLKRVWEAGELIDVNSKLGQATRARILCIHCRKIVAECACENMSEKPAAANAGDNTAVEEPEKPYDRARRRRRELMRARNRRRQMEGGVS